jgi:hypothetical protein
VVLDTRRVVDAGRMPVASDSAANEARGDIVSNSK